MKNNHPTNQPNLPAMTPHERKIWAASHNLPQDMLLVSVGEMCAMRESFDACVREVNTWRKLGKLYMGAELPELFEPAIRAYMAEKERLEKESTASVDPVTPIPLFTLSSLPMPPAGAVKIPSTTRPEEI